MFLQCSCYCTRYGLQCAHCFVMRTSSIGRYDCNIIVIIIIYYCCWASAINDTATADADERPAADADALFVSLTRVHASNAERRLSRI